MVRPWPIKQSCSLIRTCFTAATELETSSFKSESVSGFVLRIHAIDDAKTALTPRLAWWNDRTT